MLYFSLFKQCIYPKKQHVKRSDVSAFAVSRYHMPENTVNRVEGINQVSQTLVCGVLVCLLSELCNLDMCRQPNACEEAELEVRRLQDLEMEETRRREEQLEKARVRGRQALRREQLVQVSNEQIHTSVYLLMTPPDFTTVSNTFNQQQDKQH